LAGRVALTAVALAVLSLVLLQFGRVAARDWAVSRELAAERAEVLALRARERRQQETIHRLSNPRGAIPEIHEKLELVGPHEELIFLRRTPAGPQKDPP
jgi:cell division protein FtsB